MTHPKGDMTQQDIPKRELPKWVKPLLVWGLLPFIGSLSIWSLLLGKESPQGTVQPSPTVSSSPVAIVPVSPSPAPTKLPQAAKSKPTPAKPVPVQPSSFTAEQKALNDKAKQAFVASTSSVDALIEMQVVLMEGRPTVAVGASTPALVLDEKGRHLHQIEPGQMYTAQANGSAISLNGWQLPSTVWIDPGPGGLFQLGDRVYRGRLLLVSTGGLVAVNYVNMRQYLYSVVGSEVSPSWSPEALKAQAVAARSYALTYYFKPASSLYQIGATESYQVYSGIAREADTIRQAVDATAGEFVSYRGGIVESLYAASDDIVAEAFQGQGMSQLGALSLAEKGYTYHQILSNYYPKTGVGRIEEDRE